MAVFTSIVSREDYRPVAVYIGHTTDTVKLFKQVSPSVGGFGETDDVYFLEGQNHVCKFTFEYLIIQIRCNWKWLAPFTDNRFHICKVNAEEVGLEVMLFSPEIGLSN
jgi:hypothetical protein